MMESELQILLSWGIGLAHRAWGKKPWLRTDGRTLLASECSLP